MAEFEVTFDVTTSQPQVEAEFTVENTPIEALFELEGGVIVDDKLSKTSTNPVQNKVITQAIEGIQDSFFVFEQAIASDTWEVTHNLKKKPAITVVDSAENVVEGDYTYLDENRVILKFNSAFVGKAYFN